MPEPRPRPRSEELYQRAVQLMPAGVNSPVRAFRAVGGTPVFFTKGEGPYLYDVDGRKYIDFCGSWGPLILGHAHPRVVAAVRETAARGLTFGAPHEGEIALAQAMQAANPHLQKMRFVSSGTEAVMSAVRVARGFTGRDIIIKFDGCYHGHADSLLVNAGSGLVTFGTPSSAGVPADFTKHTIVCDLDDVEGFDRAMREHGGNVAGVLIEPVPANNGLLLQRAEFLQYLRKRCAETGACLIFDEVISGFRVAFGGAAQLYQIAPDLATYGKIIGGGLPVGAYGGRSEILDHVAPLGRVYQAGTLSGNPLGMAAGLATLQILRSENIYERLERLGARLESSMNQLFTKHRANASFVRRGSVFWIYLAPGAPPRRAKDLDADSARRFTPLYHELLNRGFYFGPSAYEVGFLCAAHDESHVDALAEAVDAALANGIGI
ncbi:MAG: glutamate-1-semialdehyde 2,1-aminomutase [Planctomycetes bacterium]|nr:glutamate-1-semialdehyde 2,1-aminomutase [Planctomycetota bacterium]